MTFAHQEIKPAPPTRMFCDLSQIIDTGMLKRVGTVMLEIV
jgi:hypothetical protein